jgi:hypothetical protein
MNLNENRKATANTGLAKVAVRCSADKFVVKQTVVFRINICGENSPLRQAATLPLIFRARELQTTNFCIFGKSLK